MSSKNLMETIGSKYIIMTIFSYIDNYKFKYIFFKNSKKFQSKLNLQLYQYQDEYLKKCGIHLSYYFSLYYNCNFQNYILNFDYNKDKTRKKIEEDYLNKKFDINIIENYVNGYFEDYPEYNNKIIDVDSPFFNIISKTNNFDKNFMIFISIKKEEDKKKYITIFDDLNKKNTKYSLYLKIKDYNDINCLKEFNINFNQVRCLKIKPSFLGMIKHNQNYNYLVQTLCSFNNPETNLKYLSLDLSDSIIEADSLDNINNFKSLECLELTNVKLNKTFVLKLNNLISLLIFNCNNIALSQDTCQKLKRFEIAESSLISQKSLNTFPELIELILDYFNSDLIKYKSVIDFTGSKKIQTLVANIDDFLGLDYQLLVNIKLYANRKELSVEKEKKMLEKILSIKTLVSIDIPLYSLDLDVKGDDNEITKIEGENKNVEKLIINLFDKKECELNCLQNKFPNLSSLNINYSSEGIKDDTMIIFNENKKSKINEICIKDNSNSNVSFDIQSFQSLKKIDLNNISSEISIFKNDYKYNFKTLTYFRLSHFNIEINFDTLTNICNNLDNMPNLKDFKLDCKCEKTFIRDFLDNFIKKLLEKKLNSIEFIVKNNDNLAEDFYTIEELKEKYEIINCNNLYNINIQKY